ncbi:MAG: Rrf2 family transcriptional regulator [Gemmatimonadota bacterium]|nr:Rrf2 family transcriptional regulator [Gemmatimonadota bacterium]
MWISGTSQYAIRAVVHVAAHGVDAPVRVGPIAEALDVPRNYLSKTLHALARAGVLHSERGPRGGFQLTVPPSRLTLAQVTAPFEDVKRKHCLLGRPQCGGAHACAAHARWSSVSTALQQYFASTTIADLLDDARAGRTPPTVRARPTGGPRRATSRRP